MWQVIWRAPVVWAGLVLLASFGGDLHGMGDSLAVFRPLIAAGCLVMAALVWRWWLARIVAIGAIVVAVWHGSGGVLYEGPKHGVSITVYQKNLLFLERDRAPLIADIRASWADVVTLQEVSEVNRAMLEALRVVYPHQLVCGAHTVGAVAILSRTPLQDEVCGANAGLARAVTWVNGHRVQVISLHLHWPWPFGQRDQVEGLLADLAPLKDGGTVIGGDFNMVASGRSVAWIAAETQTRRVGPMVRTLSLFGYPLGIDHVLATGGAGLLSVRPRFGSDHFGLLALIDLF